MPPHRALKGIFVSILNQPNISKDLNVQLSFTCRKWQPCISGTEGKALGHSQETESVDNIHTPYYGLQHRLQILYVTFFQGEENTTIKRTISQKLMTKSLSFYHHVHKLQAVKWQWQTTLSTISRIGLYRKCILTMIYSHRRKTIFYSLIDSHKCLHNCGFTWTKL